MKKPKQFIFVLAAAVGSLTFSCNEKKEVQNAETEAVQAEQDANDRVQEMRDHIRQEKEEFIVQARAKVDKNKGDIEDLKMVAKTKAGDAKVRYEQAIEQLRAENDRLEAKIDENKETIDEKWDNFKVDFNHDMDKLGNSIAELFEDND